MIKGIERAAKTKPNVDPLERFLSVITGTSLLVHSLRTRNRLLVPELIAGSWLLYRGYSGHCAVKKAIERNRESVSNINVKWTMIVNRPRAEVYRFWRNLSNLPLFMKHVASVHQVNERLSNWTISIPGNIKDVSWRAELVKEIPNELLSWHSLPGSEITNAGKIEFRDALGKHGTGITASVSYQPPFGKIGEHLLKLFNPVFKKTVMEDLNNFKNFIESESSLENPVL